MAEPRIETHEGTTRRVRLVVVTGTSGKTTTAWLAASVLAEAGLHVGLASDLGCVAVDGTLGEPLEGGSPAALAAWLARAARDGCTHAVIEVAPSLIATGALENAVCDTLVVTSLARKAGARGPSRSRFAQCAMSMLAPGGCLVAPREPWFAGLLAAAERRGGRACITAGLHAACDVSARPVERSLHGQTFLASAAGQVVPVAVDVPVASFARNALCAAAVGLRHGVPLHVAARGIEAAGSVAGRVERLDRGQEFATFLDAPRTGHALASTLASLRRLTPGRLAVVAEQRLVARLGAAFAGPARRRCDDVVVVPAGVLDDDPDEAAVAAYARVDRLLGGLREGDCLLVLAAAAVAGRRRGGTSLAALVDGWLRLALPARDGAARPAA